jgi:ATP-dependent DNA helicase RecQ
VVHTNSRIESIARDRFGFERLRPGQGEAIQALLDGHDSLVVMPTGSGKSAIYQIAGELIPGSTIVVSPLIALQRDQVESIDEGEPGEAAELNSTLTPRQREETLEEVEEGEVEFLFLAPEQFANEETLERLRDAEVSLFVVDEAHCISEWGHDFRPDYLRLGSVVEELGHPRVLALTATASPPVRSEIVERLELRDPHLIVRGFDRPNIHLAVEWFEDEAPKLETLVERLAAAPKPGIVYTATRAESEELAEALAARGVRAGAYHAGLASHRREEVQEAFMHDELEVVCATIAFGLGIDKRNVRFVFHAEPSDSVDAYYQEVGRAGRDGKGADAVLFYRPADANARRFFGGAARLELEQVEAVAEALAEADGPIEPQELKEETDLTDSKLTTALSRLEEVGAVEVLPTGEVEAQDDTAAAARRAVEAQERYREFERSRVEMMRGYAELRDCRRLFLLNYFGEPREEPCGFCDNCEAGIVADRSDQPFELSSRVRHEEWGEGTVERYESDKMVVLFDEVGYKTLSIDLVRERDLLATV